MQLTLDPRLPGNVGSRYDRKEIIKSITEFYQFLTKLPFIEPSDVVYPPPKGWPNITDESFEVLGKTDEVIKLLKRLPYITVAKDPEGDGYTPRPISPDTYVIDYQSEFSLNSVGPFRERFGERWFSKFVPFLPDNQKIPPWVIQLTYPEDTVSGVFWLLDTSDGTATDWGHRGTESDRDYKPDDSRSWRNDCGPTFRLADLLKDWKQKYEDLTWIAFWRLGRPQIWWYLPSIYPGVTPDDMTQESIELQKIIRDHGWPNDFRREECKQALLKWDKRTPSKLSF